MPIASKVHFHLSSMRYKIKLLTSFMCMNCLLSIYFCCPSIFVANYVGALHILASSCFWIILTTSEGGAGFDLDAAIRLEASWHEGLAGFLVAVASMIALFMFATRESEEEEFGRSEILMNAFVGCWLAACLTLALNTQEAHASRRIRRGQLARFATRRFAAGATSGQEGSDGGRALTINAASVSVLPRAWSCVLVSLSCLSHTQGHNLRGSCFSSKAFVERFRHYRTLVSSCT